MGAGPPGIFAYAHKRIWRAAVGGPADCRRGPSKGWSRRDVDAGQAAGREPRSRGEFGGVLGLRRGWPLVGDEEGGFGEDADVDGQGRVLEGGAAGHIRLCA